MVEASGKIVRAIMEKATLRLYHKSPKAVFPGSSYIFQTFAHAGVVAEDQVRSSAHGITQDQKDPLCK